MEKKEWIEMINQDLADEHSAVLRYLVHSYLEGEDTPLGASLLSRCREEMWHMHWLGMIIGKLGGEPNLTPAAYPYDPTSRETIFSSYIQYEEKLIPHYKTQGDKVDHPHIKRVLYREGWESAMHAQKFQRILDKLSPEDAKGLPSATNELPPEYVEELQSAIEKKYTLMLQHIRDSWVFQSDALKSWQLMDFSMTQMKQLAHLAEEIAENGITPRIKLNQMERSAHLGQALEKMIGHLQSSRQGHLRLKEDPQTQNRKGLMVNLDLTLKQEEYEEAEIKDWLSQE